MNTPKVSILLPTYNEADNIVPLIQEIEHTLATVDYEILVVDDNSPDKTASLVEAYKIQSSSSRIEILLRLKDRGLTNSFRDGIAKSRGQVVVWMDCDFSMPPSVIPQLLRAIDEGADVAIGSRFVAGGKQKSLTDQHESWIVVIASSVLNQFLGVLLGSACHDYTSGFVAAKREVLEKIPLVGNYGEYCIDFLAHVQAAHYRLVEIGYECQPRRAGVSKTRLIAGIGYFVTGIKSFIRYRLRRQV